MFYDLYLDLCKKNNISPTRAALEIGVSKSTPTTWKKRGLTPQGETLAKIADYFGVTTDYLLSGEHQKEKAPAPEGERPITFDDFVYAMYEEGKELTEDNKKKLLEMAQFFRQQQEKEKQ